MSRLRDIVRSVVLPPVWPGTVERPPVRPNIGLDYDTAWTRTPIARAARAAVFDGVASHIIGFVASPTLIGSEMLDELDTPVIFASNHSSHLDTTLILGALPSAIRRKTVVAAAADYFFDRTWKAVASSLLLGAIPIERTRVNRQSADIASALISEGWNLVIFDEGGRSPDGWGQAFRGGAAYIAKRSGAAVVPLHLDGARAIFPKGSKRITPGTVTIRFGRPMFPLPASDTEREEDARHFALRIETAVSVLADEAESDWWSARRRAAKGETPAYRGPEAAPWRRAWAVPANRRQDSSTRRTVKPW